MNTINISHILQCPNCLGVLAKEEQNIICTKCHNKYLGEDEIISLFTSHAQESFKQDMINFWGGGWKKRQAVDERMGTKELFLQELGAVRFALTLEETEQVKEMVSMNLTDKLLLEIGCGMGTSSVMFALQGAQIVASDLTKHAVQMTNNKFQMLDLNGIAVQADAEHLPFRDNTFDVVFSSGVLHHTPNTEQAIDEIYRVLKPGGEAVVMLYAKWSFHYLVSLFLVRGILLGAIFRYGWTRWLGHVTEANWYTKEKHLNPLTKVYSGRQMKKIFQKFTILSLRKHSFNWADICPGLYRIFPRRRVPLGDTGTIIHSGTEVAIGRWAGFDIVIHVKK